MSNMPTPTIIDLCLKRQANKEKRGMPSWSGCKKHYPPGQFLRNAIVENADHHAELSAYQETELSLTEEQRDAIHYILDQCEKSHARYCVHFPDAVRAVMEEEP